MASAVAAIVGATIKDVRERRKMTQTTAAELAGIDRVFLARVEAGRRMPSVVTLVKLAAVLEVPPADFLKRLTPAVIADLHLD